MSILVFFYSPNNNTKEEEIIRKILPSQWEENDIHVVNIINYDANKTLEKYNGTTKNIITFGKLARKAVMNAQSSHDKLIELPTAIEISKGYSAQQKLDLIQQMKELVKENKETSSHINIRDNSSIDLSIIDEVGNKEKILAALLLKDKENKKYIAHLPNKTIIEVSERKEIKGSIHMTLEDLFTLYLMKDILGASIVEIKKGGDNG